MDLTEKSKSYISALATQILKLPCFQGWIKTNSESSYLLSICVGGLFESYPWKIIAKNDYEAFLTFYKIVYDDIGENEIFNSFLNTGASWEDTIDLVEPEVFSNFSTKEQICLMKRLVYFHFDFSITNTKTFETINSDNYDEFLTSLQNQK